MTLVLNTFWRLLKRLMNLDDRCLEQIRSDTEKDEYHREEEIAERQQDELLAVLQEGWCPNCHEYSVLFRNEPDEKLYYCNKCGGRWT